MDAMAKTSGLSMFSAQNVDGTLFRPVVSMKSAQNVDGGDVFYESVETIYNLFTFFTMESAGKPYLADGVS